jgi:hypothetical protein
MDQSVQMDPQNSCEGYLTMLRIHVTLVEIRMRIRGSIPLTNGSDPDADPAFFVSDLHEVDKKKFLIFFSYYFYILFNDKKL